MSKFSGEMFGLAPSSLRSYLALGNGCWAFIWAAGPRDQHMERRVRSLRYYSGFTIHPRFCFSAPNSPRSTLKELVAHLSRASTQFASKPRKSRSLNKIGDVA